MTDTLPIAGGPTNREIIDMAYRAIGLSDSMFGRTDEEYAAGMAELRAMMGEWPFDALGYDDTGTNPQERSGIARTWITAVAYSLAERIGNPVGKTLSPQFRKVLTGAYSKLCAAANVTPAMRYADGTPSGAGYRRRIGTFMRGTLENS